MDQLKNNQFAVAIAGIVIVYVILYMFIVSPVYTDSQQGIGILKRKLAKDKSHLDKFLKSNRKKQMPSPKLIKYHSERKKELNEAKQNIYEIFVNKSKAINQPFKEVEDREKQNGTKVSLSYFQQVYESKITNIVEEFAGKEEGLYIGEKQQEDDDFFGGDGNPNGREKQIKDILKFDVPGSIVNTSTQSEAQKKFWIIKNMIDIMEESQVKSLKQLLVRKGTQEEDSKFEEYDIEMSIDVNFSQVPTLVQKILQSPKMLTEITSVNMVRNENYTAEDISVFIKIGQTKEEAKAEALKEKGIVAIPVNVKVGCKVLNYLAK